ncbi:G2/mitotic-specific cyclin-2 [Nakaseomyces glabratus]|nr:G2/mitotic-specific cyclin-2 [Nakaseomyces glabratus]KTB25861.1 G2/mitotic-specific cyclin-2 [Nakaseomyces glabratus]
MDSKIIKNYLLPKAIYKPGNKIGATIFNDNRTTNNKLPLSLEKNANSLNIMDNTNVLKSVLKNYKCNKSLPYSSLIDKENISNESSQIHIAKENSEVDLCNTTLDNAYEYLLKLDEDTYLPDTILNEYSSLRQTRDLLLNWVIKIHQNLKLENETLYMTIDLIDKFLIKKKLPIEKFQLLGLTCLYIASKYEEVLPPSIFQFALESDGIFDSEEIKESEFNILETLNFKIGYPSPIVLLDRQLDGYLNYNEMKFMSLYLLEITFVDFRFLSYRMSMRTKAAALITLKMYNHSIKGLKTRFQKEGLMETIEKICRYILQYLLEPTIHTELQRKYSQLASYNVADRATKYVKCLIKKYA